MKTEELANYMKSNNIIQQFCKALKKECLYEKDKNEALNKALLISDEIKNKFNVNSINILADFTQITFERFENLGGGIQESVYEISYNLSEDEQKMFKNAYNTPCLCVKNTSDKILSALSNFTDSSPKQNTKKPFSNPRLKP